MTSVSIGRRPAARGWGFLTSHALVLLELERTPDPTVAELARRTGLTARQMHRVIDDLVASGYVSRTRVGRRNHYTIDSSQPMRHPSLAHHRVSKLLAALTA